MVNATFPGAITDIKSCRTKAPLSPDSDRFKRKFAEEKIQRLLCEFSTN
jgi:hypothetical protein